MAQTNDATQQDNNTGLRDLQPLLRRCYSCEELKVLKVRTAKLLPLGENFCSTIIKIEAEIKRSDESSSTETLHLVAKTFNRTERPLINWFELLPKEVFVYSKLLPTYKELERRQGVKETDVIDILPKLVGYRFSLDFESDKVDEDSLLLMDNMTTRGYYTCSKLIGLDRQHAEKALSALARYHALGIVAKNEKPDFFNSAVAQAKVLGIDFEQVAEGLQGCLKNLRTDPCFADYSSEIEKCFEKLNDGGMFAKSPEEPWATITHGDFWVNNVLFRKNEAGIVDDCKLVDFQTYLYDSPLRDLPYFLCGSLDDVTTEKHLEDLLSLYYDNFVKTLKRMKQDAGIFSRDSFDRELKVQAINTFPINALAIKIFVHELQGDPKCSGEVMQSIFEFNPSDAYRNRLLRLLKIYERKGWF